MVPGSPNSVAGVGCHSFRGAECVCKSCKWVREVECNDDDVRSRLRKETGRDQKQEALDEFVVLLECAWVVVFAGVAGGRLDGSGSNYLPLRGPYADMDSAVVYFLWWSW